MIRKILQIITWPFRTIRNYMDYWDFKPSGEVIGLVVMLVLMTAAFFLPSYNPGFEMNPEKFTELCARYDYELQDVSAEYNPSFFHGVAASDNEDYRIIYYDCTKGCYARFFMWEHIYEAREGAYREKNTYTSEFNRTYLYSADKISVVYRNDLQLVFMEVPKEDAEKLDKFVKKSKIHRIKEREG